MAAMLIDYFLCNLLFLSSVFAENETQRDDFIPCERGWFLFKEKCYKLGGKKKTGKLSWDKASEICKENGGSLATVNSKELNDFLMAFLVLDAQDSAWIGLHDKGEEAVYAWDDGSPFDYANWEPGGPRGPENEDCFEMLFRSLRENGEPGQWNDLPCDHERAYICQAPKSKQTKKTPDPRFCRGMVGAWKYQTSCYNIVTDKLSWQEAEEHCQSKFLGHLVTIHDFTVDLFLDYILANLDREIWIGIQVKEQPLQKWTSGWFVAYSDWSDAQGDFVEGTCALLSKPRLWTTTPCSRKHSFVCERSSVPVPTLPSSSKGSQCPELPDDWKDLGGDYCYFFDTKSHVNWNQANFECMSRGGTLVSIHSSEQNAIMQPFIKFTQARMFIGLFRLAAHDDAFVWSDGSHVDFLSWNTGEPNSEKEMCVELWTSTMTWNDVRCDKNNGFICSVRKLSSNITEISTDANCPDGMSWKALVGVGVCVLLLVILLMFVIYRLKPYGAEERRKRSNAGWQPPVPNTERPKYRFKKEITVRDDEEYENMA